MADLSAWTAAMRQGLGEDPTHGAVVPPIYLSTNYTFADPLSPGRYDYSRSGNPTREVLGSALATLEGGYDGIVVNTGLAAGTLLATALVPVGGRVLLQHDPYGGTWRLFEFLASRGHFSVVPVDFEDPEQVAAGFTQGCDLVWLESPSNPLLRITDIRAVADRAHLAGAKLVVDNTFCTPLGQQPLALGADLVVHSTTKFINGHSDVVGGAVVAADQQLHDQLALWANALGLTGGAFDSYLVMRGLRTLEARLRVHEASTADLVAAIDGHPALAALHYPGLPSHTGHKLANRQQRNFGSLVTLELSGGFPAVQRFLDELQVFHLAESLGGVESLVCHPATMTHAGMTAAARAKAGITNGLVRLSVGLEASQDLIAAVLAGLERATA